MINLSNHYQITLFFRKELFKVPFQCCFLPKGTVAGLLFLLTTTCGFGVNISFFTPSPDEFNDDVSNSVRRPAQGVVNISDTDVTFSISAPIRRTEVQVEIDLSKLADIIIVPEFVSKTKAQIAQDGELSANLTIFAKPNPFVNTGYTVEMQMLAQRLNFNFFQSTFFQYQAIPLINQAFPVIPNFNNLMYFNILHNKLAIKPWLRLPSGVVISDSWITDQIIQVDNSLNSTKTTNFTFNIKIPADHILSLPNGPYYFSLTAIMTPYTPPTTSQLIASTGTIVILQFNQLKALINQIDGLLISPFSYTQAAIAQLIENRRILVELLAQVVLSAEIYFTKIFNEPTTTIAEKAQITAILDILT